MVESAVWDSITCQWTASVRVRGQFINSTAATGTVTIVTGAVTARMLEAEPRRRGERKRNAKKNTFESWATEWLQFGNANGLV